MRTLLAVSLMVFSLPALSGSCTARSGPGTTALVELYTSEGCSSCPPADRWLSSLGTRGYVPDKVVPLALHVDYWDYLGWKDPYAQARFGARQRKLTALQRLALVFTPQVMLQGQDYRGWQGNGFEATLRRINAQAARASLFLEIDGAGGNTLAVRAQADVPDAAERAKAVLYLAAYANRLASSVTAGENSGRTLSHDYVVLEWRGPYALDASGRLMQKARLSLLPNAVPADSGVAAFVQNSRSLEVLQALLLPFCRPGKG